MRKWVRQNAGGNVTTARFIALAERVSGQDLAAFFDEWLFTPGRPASLDPVAAPTARSLLADRSSRALRRAEATRR